MVESQVCPGAALEYWPGGVRERLVKNDIFTAKNTNLYWYGGGGGAGQNFQPVKISPRKVVIIGEFPRLPGTLHMAGKLPTKYLFFFFSRPWIQEVNQLHRNLFLTGTYFIHKQ